MFYFDGGEMPEVIIVYAMSWSAQIHPRLAVGSIWSDVVLLGVNLEPRRATM